MGPGTSTDNDEEIDFEDRLNEVMLSRGRQPNLSFFAFTATPKGKTIELFGRKDGNGKPGSFHIYSMMQAIEEGFILDVKKNYTTYNIYYKLIKAVEDDPKYLKKKGNYKKVVKIPASSSGECSTKNRGDYSALSTKCPAFNRQTGQGYGSGWFPFVGGKVYAGISKIYKRAWI